MASIFGLLNRIEAVDTDKIAEEAMQESAEKLADLNAEQINTGLKADGSTMPDYSFRSVFQYGKQPGPIKLRDKGDWQAGLYVKVEGSAVVFGSTDPKDDMLRQRYGDEIEGLSEKYKAEGILEAVQPAFTAKMEAATGLKMK